MEEVNKFLVRVWQDCPKIRFVVGKKFAFRPPRTIFLRELGGVVVDKNGVRMRADAKVTADELERWRLELLHELERWRLELLHELGHARLEHKNFTTDVERLKMECAAWEEARGLARDYDVKYDEEFVEEELDSYRDWLHSRSKCPRCGMTRYQTVDGEYHCPQCSIGVVRL